MERCNRTMMTKKEQREKIVTCILFYLLSHFLYYFSYSCINYNRLWAPLSLKSNQSKIAGYDHTTPVTPRTQIMSGIPSLTILSEEQKFNGDNLLQWKTNITQLLGSKGLLGYIDGKIPKPGPKSIPFPSEPLLPSPSVLKRSHHRQMDLS